MIIYYVIAAIIVGIDQLVKYLTVQNISLYETVTAIPNVLSFTYHQNSGAAWSILEGQMWFFIIVTLIVIGVIVYFLHTQGRQSFLFSSALTLLLAGAIGNLIDRVLNQYVVDMFRLEFVQFPIFNVADMSLTFGVGLMILYLILDEIKTFKQKKAVDK
ncbi:signal peptidase II [Marinilactibacillus sp. Marseille-P9653]|uniref:signal peptidase II n=1 Tax=Marinilactibacillus sp. Marseille-P9653 TaxID=2866583 RepID=UPI001CE3BB9E|nr:signal peptidase II [Marinilactibacillus sp. Marseille-P9653]